MKPFFSLVVLSLLLVGCYSRPQLPPPGKPAVVVSLPVQDHDIMDYLDFTGRVASVEYVDLKSRVTGYLMEIYFQAGQMVVGPEEVPVFAARLLGSGAMIGPQAPLAVAELMFPGRPTGSLLFLIDPRTYQADYDRALGNLKVTEARLKLTEADLARALELEKTPGAISPKQVDQYRASQGEAAASVEAARANLEVYRINLDFTRIYSPVSGIISRNYLTKGNLINKDDTLLTTIVSVDPMYVYFDVDDQSLMNLKREMRAGRLKMTRRGDSPVMCGLSGEDGYPHAGFLDFVDNREDSLTGTLSVRGVFPNPQPQIGPRLMTTNQFARVRVPLGNPYRPLLVAEKAVGTDQGQKYLLVADGENKVQIRRVTLGPLQEDGLRVIRSGLGPNERVIVSGIQQVRPGMEVEVDTQPMPTIPLPGAEVKPTPVAAPGPAGEAKPAPH